MPKETKKRVEKIAPLIVKGLKLTRRNGNRKIPKWLPWQEYGNGCENRMWLTQDRCDTTMQLPQKRTGLSAMPNLEFV